MGYLPNRNGNPNHSFGHNRREKISTLSVIKDRADNADVYEREYFSKYPNYGYSRRKIGFSIDDLWEPKKKKYFPGRRRIMNSSTRCKHKPLHEIENRLYPDYDDGLFQRMYIELKEEIRSLTWH